MEETESAESRNSTQSTMGYIVCEECGAIVCSDLVEYHMKDVHFSNVLKPLHNNKSNNLSYDPISIHVLDGSCKRDIHEEKLPSKIFYQNKSNYCMQLCIIRSNAETRRENEKLFALLKKKLM
ncbi:hypothetical protein AVEN_33016-1 [Araneus ventricosus]|uniref:Uncharacterized protein n=1 Tax=Araneus ventricosus TaxID=182803 RepID=A0A4Y2N8C6_ARAVE|nr:hypothetical protein AVEN_33016-1 [Araneus ventricosus]